MINNHLVFLTELLCSDDKYNGGFKKESSTADNIFILYTLIQRQKALLHQSVSKRIAPRLLRLADRIGLWTTQSPHPIEQLARQRGFPLLRGFSLGP